MNKQCFPLTGPQKNFWHLEQVNQDNKNLNIIYTVMKLPHDIDLKLLDKTLNKIREINDSLRIHFSLDKTGELFQYIEKYEYIPSRIIYTDSEDLSTVIENEKSDILSINGKLNELAIIQNNSNCFVLYKSHHILSDGWGMTQVADQIKEIYYMLENGEDFSNYKKPSYLDFVSREQEYIKSSRYARDIDFWQKAVKDIEPCTIFKNINNFDKTAKRYEKDISKNTCNQITDFCNKHKITEYSFFLAIISIYFYNFYSINNFAIGTPFLNRQKRFNELEETGLHISTLPLHININNDMNFVDLCKNINSSNLNIYKRGSFPYYNIQKLFESENNTNSNLYEIGFSYQINISEKEFKSKNYEKNASNKNDEIGDCTWIFSGQQNNAITFHLTQLNYKKIFAIDYLTSIFSEEKITKIYDSIFQLINQVIDYDKNSEIIKILDFNLLSAEQLKLLKKFNQTGNFTEIDKNLIDYFEEIVQKHPNKTALICNNAKMSYKDFYDKVTVLADIMIDNGVFPNSPIVLFFDKSFDMIIAMFAVMKIGCYYIPILPDEEKNRINYIINDCQPSCILTHKNYNSLLEKLPYDFINLDKIFSTVYEENIGFDYENWTNNTIQISIKNKSIKPSDIAYTIYTSGSTGNPKGVQVMHKNILSLIESMKQDNLLKPNFSDVSMSLLKYSFDASGIDIYSSLLTGGTLLIVDKKDELNPIKVLELIEKYKVTRSFLIPKWIENIISTENNYNYNISSLKLLGSGGELLKTNILKDFKEKYPNINIFNLYGPTEVTMFSTYKLIDTETVENTYSTIGKPIPGSRIAILNSNNLVLPTDCEGELVIYEDKNSIENISKGYLHLPEQTEKKFIKFFNPITNSLVNGYKTGDIAKINNNLELEFIGRNDDIVKVNGGYLVALNEVEKRISDLLGDNIENYCVAVPYKNTKVIVLFINNSEKNISIQNIKNYLKNNLSFYMQPKKIIELDEVPRISSGKVHRQELKRIAIKELQVRNSNIVKPRSEIELEIYNIVKDLIHIDDFSITDDFLDDLGIDSLALTTLCTSLEKYKLNMQDFYNYPSIQDLAEFIENKNQNSSLVPETDNIDIISESLSKQLKSNSFDLSSVLLTGVTGFLGIHLLRELLLNKKVKKIYCIIRNKIGIEGPERLKNMIDFYYNSDKKIFDLIDEKVIILNGEITKPNFNLSVDTYSLLQNTVKTVINSAGNVKHFSKPMQIKNDNVVSVDNIIDFCRDNISFAHISTMSIAGFKDKNTTDDIFDEKTIYINQSFNNNPYLITKFNAEKHILDAVISKGLQAKIFRLGNIMPRVSDGIFQINKNQNIFMNAFKTILNLQVISEEMINFKVEFSPVDECATSILKLCNDNSAIIYHVMNNNEISIKNIIKYFEKSGHKIEIVSANKFVNSLKSIDDVYVKEYILGTNLNKISLKNSLNILKNYNFEWSKTDELYIKNIINLIE